MPHNNNIHLPKPDAPPAALSHTVPDEMFAVNDLKKPKAAGVREKNKQSCLHIYSTKSEADVVAPIVVVLVVVVTEANCK